MNGAESLSDAELIAILIRTGSRSQSAVDLARLLLDKFGNLNNLCNRDISEFKLKGIGMVKSVTLSAAFELSKRIKSSPFNDKKIIKSPDDLANYYIPRLNGARIESFRVLILNSANQIIREKIISEGSLNSSIVHPREVFRFAITESGAAIMLMHNHPSGNPEPSDEDIKITRQLVEAGKLIGIKVLDHLIIAGDNFTSFARRGLI